MDAWLRVSAAEWERDAWRWVLFSVEKVCFGDVLDMLIKGEGLV